MKKPWELCAYKPRICHHPALASFAPNDWYPAIVVVASESEVMLYDLNYLLMTSDGYPASGFPYTPLDHVKLEFDQGADEWRIIDQSRENFIYRLSKPTKAVRKMFEENLGVFPSFKDMQDNTRVEFGHCPVYND